MEKKNWRVVNCLRELRHMHGLTQEKLAEDLGVTRHTILALEVATRIKGMSFSSIVPFRTIDRGSLWDFEGGTKPWWYSP